MYVQLKEENIMKKKGNNLFSIQNIFFLNGKQTTKERKKAAAAAAAAASAVALLLVLLQICLVCKNLLLNNFINEYYN